MIITKSHISRRTVLRGLGVSLALPFLDAMVPALTPIGKTAAATRTRLAAIEMVHGAAGSTAIGRANNYWSPVKEGADFEFTRTLKPLEALREYLTVISDTDLQNAMGLTPVEVGKGSDHVRSSAAFLTAAHPKRTLEADIESGPSIDQIYAQRIGHETRFASAQLCLERPVQPAGDCGNGYNCSYMGTISWASPTRPLPMEIAPRAAFELLFGAPADEKGPARTATRTATRIAARKGGRSTLDLVADQVAKLRKHIGAADRARLDRYLDDVRDVERRIQAIEKHNSSSTTRQSPAEESGEARLSVPDSFEEHANLMFDLQILGFMGDVTRVFAFKMATDRSMRIYPESGVTTPFHALSHHGEQAEKIEEYAKLNQYHVSKVAYFLNRLKDTPDGDGNLLDHSVVVYGSPMGDSDVHEHKYLPLFLAGHANGKLKGNLHLRCAPGTPMANVWLTLLHKLGVDVDRIGDSTGEVAI